MPPYFSTSTLDEASESISGLYSKTLSKSYDSLGRLSGQSLAGDSFDMAFGYDATGRLGSIGWNHGSFGVSYLAYSDLLSSISMPGGHSANFAYEAHRDLLLNVDNKDSSNATVSKYAYANDATGRRTSMERTGTAFSMSETLSYGYNSRSEVTSATSNTDPAYVYGYSFDSIGNRLTSSERGVASTYTSNNLNQYTAIDITTPTYDYDGNMLTNGMGWAYEWDAENRLKAAVSGTRRVEFAYDYMSRRVEARVYDSGTLTSHWRFVYSGYKHVETLNGANGNALLQKYLWSGDRLLATYDVADAAAYSYFIDGNKNVGQLIDASGSVVAKYEYGPFGQLTRCEGSYADANPYRFSSEQYDSTLSLVYYNYRYYSPSLGRWLSKDPIAEKGGANLYAMLANALIQKIDALGLIAGVQDGVLKKFMKNYDEGLDSCLNGCKRRLKDCQRKLDECRKKCPMMAAQWARGQLSSQEQGVLDVLAAGAEGYSKGTYATLDGIIPFADPFANNGVYDPSDPNYQFSQAMGGVARDALLTAAVPNLSVWAKNPIAYEVGQTTLSAGKFEALEGLSAIERGTVLAEQSGGYLKAALSTNWPQTLKTVSTGLTPGGNIAVIAGVHAVDHYQNSIYSYFR